MRIYGPLGLGIAIFVIGALIGREYFPKPPGGSGIGLSDNSKSSKGLASGPRTRDDDAAGGRLRSGALPQNASRLSELLTLVEQGDRSVTGNRMHAALDGLGAEELEGLLFELNEQNPGPPLFQITLSGIFNNLAFADPVRALKYAKNHPDRGLRNQLTVSAIRTLAKSDLAAAKRALDDISEANVRLWAHNAVLQVAVGSNPASVPGLLDGLRQPIQPNLITQWAAKNPGAAEDYARALDNFDQRSGALSAVALGRAQTDPDGALAWARSLDHADGRRNAVRGVLGVIANSDPERVSRMLAEIPAFADRREIINTVTSAWIKKDQAAALAWLDSLPSNQAQFQGYRTAVNEIMQRDPAAAAGLLDRLPLNEVHNMVGNIASTWAQQDFQAARSWVSGLENPIEINAGVGSLIHIWAAQDPASAIEFLEGEAGDLPIQNRGDLINNLANQWSQREPEAALDWAQGIANETHRKGALTSVHNNLVMRNPGAAADGLASLVDPFERELLINSLANSWPSRDPEAALDWFNQLNSEDRASVDTRVLGNLSQTAPERASELYDRLMVESDETHAQTLSNAAGAIAGHWSEHDPAAAARWAEQIVDAQGRKQAVEEVSNHWVRFDPIGAAEWIGSLPSEELRDSATRPLVNHIAGAEPASAFAWAQSIGNNEQRFSAIENVIRQWGRSDRQAASEAVATADVTSEQRQQLQSKLK